MFLYGGSLLSALAITTIPTFSHFDFLFNQRSCSLSSTCNCGRSDYTVVAAGQSLYSLQMRLFTLSGVEKKGVGRGLKAVKMNMHIRCFASMTIWVGHFNGNTNEEIHFKADSST